MEPSSPIRNATLQVPQSTPVKANLATTLPFTTTQKYRVESVSALAQEIKRYLVGPMPPQQFLDEFFPLSAIKEARRVPLFKPGCYNAALSVKYEKDVYEPFVSI